MKGFRGAALTTVYISYRRRDTASAAAWIFDRLVNALGTESVYKNVELVELGVDFAEAIGRAVAKADVVLVLIGPNWFAALNREERWGSFTADDYVRSEIVTAFATRKRVIPVLVDGASMPLQEELPPDLERLARLNPLRIDTAEFGQSTSILLDAIHRIADGPTTAPRPRMTTTGEELRTLAVDFFRSARRIVEDTVDRRLLGPEPILILDSPALTAQDLADIEGAARGRQRLYLVHPDRLDDTAVRQLDRLRTLGTPIVALSANALAAAITDGRARVVLSELEREYGSGRNLFETRNSVMDERFLFGRSELLTRLGGAIAAAESVLLTGLRKAGKTSVLNILRQNLVDYPVCHLDLQRFDRADERWPGRLFDEVVTAYDRWGSTHYPKWRIAARDGDPFSDMSTRREQQLDIGRRTPFVLLLDELERVLPLPGDAAAATHFARASGLIRALAQSYPGWIVVIGADLRPTANRTNLLPGGETNPFFQFFSEMPIRLLDQAAVEEMVSSVCHAMGVWSVDAKLSREVHRLSGGHPALVRMIAGASFRDRRNTAALRSADLPRGLAELAEDNVLGSFFSQNFWEPMTASEQQIVRGASAVSSRWRRPGASSAVTEADAEAKAALTGQGLLRDGRIAVEAFVEWVRSRGG